MENFDHIESDIKNKVKNVSDKSSLDSVKTEIFGKKGIVTELFKKIGNLNQNEKKQFASKLNLLKTKVTELLEKRLIDFEQSEINQKLRNEKVDITLPGRTYFTGKIHPVSQVIDEVTSIFSEIGFSVEEGPDVESEYNNFTALNTPENHPARDMHDTFYLDNGALLRTHTSPVQIRTMEKQDPPIRIISPGRVYRKDSDLTHTPMFHMIEGLVLEENASFSVLKGMLKDFINDFFGNQTELRFRPSYFPFTEPSAEVDIKWKKGWLEILGCGMVHPNVLEMSGINSKKYSGFAFGLGPERMAMLKYNIPDLRSFFENDLRFLKQFR